MQAAAPALDAPQGTCIRPTRSAFPSRLGLTLPTVSGVLADLDRAGFVERHPDPADRRRTIVQIPPAQAAQIGEWLDGAAKPLARPPTRTWAGLRALAPRSRSGL